MSEVYPHVEAEAGATEYVSIRWGPSLEAHLYLHTASHSEVSLCTLHTDVVHAHKRIKYTLGPCVLKQGQIPFSRPWMP